ncbi:MAG: DUF167 domain-containing protein [Hyphomicrobiaceae bacterium]|nr:DUF167 domain-containing protein [Hyphomicrobiaceae bacterium]
MTPHGTGDAPWRPIPTGLAIRVRLTPRSQREGIEGLEETAEGMALKARVRAVPEDGAANAALERLIADWLGLPKTAVTVAAGGRSRLKTVAIAGNPEALRLVLAGRLAGIDGVRSRQGS